MKRHRYTDEQIIGILREAEAGVPLADLVRQHGISSASFYAWRKKYGGMDPQHAANVIAGSTHRTKLPHFLPHPTNNSETTRNTRKQVPLCFAGISE